MVDHIWNNGTALKLTHSNPVGSDNIPRKNLGISEERNTIKTVRVHVSPYFSNRNDHSVDLDPHTDDKHCTLYNVHDDTPNAIVVGDLAHNSALFAVNNDDSMSVFQLGLFLRALRPARTGLRPARFTRALPELKKKIN